MSSSSSAAAGCESPPAAISDAPSASTATSSFSDPDASRWSSLAADLLDPIGWRVLATGDLLDYVRLRAACSHWRASTASPRGRGVLDQRFHPRQWRILPPDDCRRRRTRSIHETTTTTKRFLNVSTGAITSTRLDPDLLAAPGDEDDDHVVIDSVDGLLLLLLPPKQQHGGGGGSRGLNKAPKPVRLLNPFTGDALDLPPITAATLQPGWAYQIRDPRDLPGNMATALSIIPTGAAAATVTIAIRDMPCVLYAATGDRQWGVSAWTLSPSPLPVSFQGKLYVLGGGPPTTATGRGSNGTCPIFELDPLLPAPKLIATCPLGRSRSPFLDVMPGWETLVVKGYDTGDAVVYRVADLVAGKMEPYARYPPNSFTVSPPVYYS